MRNLDRLSSLHLAAGKPASDRVDENAGPLQHDPMRESSKAKRSRSVVRLWKEKQHNANNGIKLIKFLLVGGLGVIINSLALVVLHQFLRFPLVIASLAAVELAIVNNFLWNDRWTFGRKERSLQRFFQFNLVSCGGLVITTGTLWVLVSHLAAPYLLANLLGIGLATCWNFGMSLLWTWGSVG